ncbi:MAG TPA: hypothetical protein VJV79_25150 [Polyangiaceae bacterium]|nr:hypothetical protein [Polyangiaceae bacterium]
MSIIGVAVSCAALTALAPRVCSATPPAENTASDSALPRANVARRWYGWQTFAADGAAGAFFLAAVADDHNTTLFGLSGLTFALAAPTLHLANGHWDFALGSLGLRILGPFLGAAIGAQSDVRVSEDATGVASSNKWGVAGAGIGGLVVSAIDGLLIAYDTKGSAPVPPRKQLLRLELPQLLLLRHGIGLGYSGQF